MEHAITVVLPPAGYKHQYDVLVAWRRVLPHALQPDSSVVSYFVTMGYRKEERR